MSDMKTVYDAVIAWMIHATDSIPLASDAKYKNKPSAIVVSFIAYCHIGERENWLTHRIDC